MIDWLSLAFNALWILGLSVVLAALSLASYRAAGNRRALPRRSHALRRHLRARDIRLALLAGLTLVFVGALLSSAGAWERIVSAVGSILCLVALAGAFKERQGKRPDSLGDE